MKHSWRTIDRMAVSLTRAVLRFRWPVIAIAVLSGALLGSGATRLQFLNNYRVFFSAQNPELVAFEDLQATYTKNDNFLFVLEPAGGDVFTPETLVAIERLTEAAWQIPYAIRVDSLTNFQHSYGVDDDLVVEDLFRNSGRLSDAEIARRRNIAIAEPLINSQLVTPDGRAAAVNVVLQYPEVELTEVPEAVAWARGIRDELEAAYPNLEISLTGVSMLNNSFAETGMSDLGLLVPVMFAVILALTVLVLRSITATAATLAVIVFSAIAAMGWAGYVGIGLTPISGSAPIIILTLAIADSIHILLSLRNSMRDGLPKFDAIVEAMRLNFVPVTITSLTTIIGFLALNFSDSPPFWHLGNITAVGIAAAWLWSITLLPALMSVLPYSVERSTHDSRGERFMTRVADFVSVRPWQALWAIGGGAVALAAFIPTLQLNDQWTEYFDHSVEFRRETDRALAHFGMYPIEYSLPARGQGGVSDPEYLEHLERFTEYLRTEEGVLHVYSFADIMKRLNKNLHGDDEAFYKVPFGREEAAQYLLLYELSLPYGLDLNDRINIDKSATRVTATLTNVTSMRAREFLADTQDWINTNLPDWMHSEPTSAAVMFTHIAQRNVQNMVAGTVMAILLISLILMLSLRSTKLGLISLAANGLPILSTFGAWALLIGEVGFSVATVASISLGIIVDDTVHLLSKYQRARNERGGAAADAVRYAFRNVGIAVIVNTVILMAGFLVLLTSSFKINVDMGLLTAMAIAFALVLDFFLLPALLVLTDRGADIESTQGVNEMKTSSPSFRPQGATAAFAGVLLSALAAGSVMLAQPAFADDAAASLTTARGTTPAEQRGFEVAARSDRSDRGFGNSRVDVQMLLRNSAGRESTRALSIATLEVPDESLGDKSLVVFDSPNDIKGTALLSHARILEPDDQWLYLPALKRVKRVSSANKSGPFVGSEFAFEDFTALELNKYDYEWVSEESIDGQMNDVVERTPRYENSGYSRQLSWVDRDVYQVRKVEFYDRRGDLLKTLTLLDYREYDGVWRAHRMNMVNHQTGKSTDLIYGDYEFAAPLGEGDFDRGVLTRLR